MRIHPKIVTDNKHICYHCGEDCIDSIICEGANYFCCEGCHLVYSLLSKNGLCDYYNLNENPGLTQKAEIRADKFAFLDDETVKKKLLVFTDGKQSKASFYLPQIHCSSCIWLLENLHKLHTGVLSSRVDFPKKTIDILFSENELSLRKVAELLTRIGYEPHISLKDIQDKDIRKIDRKRLIRLGVAGFCFGNIMMLSLPEYFSGGAIADLKMKHLFSMLNLVLSLPVFFYCAAEFYTSALGGLKQKFLNIDTPIAMAIVITFLRSVYEILSGTGAGYLDSMAGIVFLMLIGRVFQDYTYQALSFERDFKSYFPVSVCQKKDGQEIFVPISEVKAGDRILIRSNELIPADGILFLGKAKIDYSFVTGESELVEKSLGEILYAGGKQTGGEIELEVIKDVSQSYLTQLWNNSVFKEHKNKRISFIHALGRYFTWILFGLAAASAAYWYFHNPARIWAAVTAILIVACPCALLLSATFTNGHILRIMGRNGLYLKNSGAIEALAGADMIVFDKTGTISQNGPTAVHYEGPELGLTEQQLIRSLARQSNHILSRAIAGTLPESKTLKVENYKEYIGQGAEGDIRNVHVRMGSAVFSGISEDQDNGFSKVYVQIDGGSAGCFMLKNVYRKGVESLITRLRRNYAVALLSGDNDTERNYLSNVFGPSSRLNFNQSPQQKLRFISDRQEEGRKVIMVGDGLNDSGALKQSDAGIALSDDINNFSPACDCILSAERLGDLPAFLAYAKAGKKVILSSFIISMIYNTVGLGFAVQGTLSPLIAAILMPISSISILVFTTGASRVAARLCGLKAA
ncbi:MAG: heavy metal translocating P-type ATPase [Bacteroidia bacterium]